jgi:hypothetical protein
MSANDFTPQAGVRNLRIEWVTETTIGVTPDDPEYERFSDNIASILDWEPDANTQTQRGVGNLEPQGFFNGSETHEVSVEYHLQNWYCDGSDNTVDPGGDFLRTNDDNTVRNTHSIQIREEHSSGGTDGAGKRIYTVIKGAHPSSITVPFETEDGSPINQTLEYQAEKIRQYDISQPSSSTTLDITNNGSSSVDVTIEDEGAGTSETNTVASGGTSVTTTESFGDIDAVELSTDVDGTVEVSDGSGTTFVTIDGSDSYPADEGDLGVPALGSGSHASAIGTDYIRFLDDTLEYSGGTITDEFISGELSVDLGLESNSRTGSARQNIHATAFDPTVTAELAGDRVTVEQTQDYLQESQSDIVWTADEGSITVQEGFIQSPGSVTYEAENGKITMESEWLGTGLTVTN